MTPYKLPYRWKYLQENPLFSSWFVFGIHKETGNVDLSDGDSDIFTDLPVEAAARIIAARDKFLEEIEAVNSSLSS